MQEWRASFRIPDALILRRRLCRTLAQDAEVEDKPPHQPGGLDDAAVAQKLAKIGAKCLRRWCVRRAELNEEDTSHVSRQAAVSSNCDMDRNARLPTAYCLLPTSSCTPALPWGLASL